ncbi:Type A flavoprotein FprA [uncultured archaeon]|nr:Type A flavoprotein FprA [uncultured archaeon]
MPKLVIIYGTGSHNTERIAKAIEEGAKAEGIETVLKNVSFAEKNHLIDADAIAIGSPNYRDAMMPSVLLSGLMDGVLKLYRQSINN